MAKPKTNRKRRGYFWRVGRGWSVTHGKSKVLLYDELGKALKSRDVPKATIVAAVKRLQQEAVRIEAGGFTMKELVNEYLLEAGPKLKASTYKTRADFLHDFVSGFRASTRYSKEQPPAHQRLHRGFASVVASDLTSDHIKQWLKAHSDWAESGGQRIGKAAVLCVLNWAAKEKKIKANPIKGIGLGKARSRLTYLTGKQEQAMLENALPDFADVLKILIRTGARYGCEFAMLRHRHVTFEERGMVWTFQPQESKTGSRTDQERRLYITDPEVNRLTKEAMERNDGIIFRNRFGRPWNVASIRMAFNRLLAKVQAMGIEFDEDICPYTLRHTFAKRTLSGHWHGGKPNTIEHLAALMGNTAEVCRKYAAWCPADMDPIWAGA